MISLFTRSVAESFHPVGPTPFLSVTLLQFLLSQNWSQQTQGPWHAVTLCLVQEAGQSCNLLMKRTWCVDLFTERRSVILYYNQGAVLTSSGALDSENLESKTCTFLIFCAIAAPLLHGAK